MHPNHAFFKKGVYEVQGFCPNTAKTLRFADSKIGVFSILLLFFAFWPLFESFNAFNQKRMTKSCVKGSR